MRGNLLYYPLSARLLLQVLASWQTFRGVHRPPSRMQLQWLWHFAVSSTRFYSLLHRMNPVSNCMYNYWPAKLPLTRDIVSGFQSYSSMCISYFPNQTPRIGLLFLFFFLQRLTQLNSVCMLDENKGMFSKKNNNNKRDSCGGWHVWFQEGDGVFSLSMGSNPHLVPTFSPPIGYRRLNIDRHITI